jgi:hypothetical protein
VSDEFFRKYCLEWHAKSVRDGFFFAARHMLRSALKFRRGGRTESLAREYFWRRGKLTSYYWGN